MEHSKLFSMEHYHTQTSLNILPSML